MSTPTQSVTSSWPDLLAEGRLARLALILLGVWLNAADSLVSSTIMPSVARELGGYAFFSWATAGFLVGAILAGASAGLLSEKYGLRAATVFAGVVFAAGCLVSAMAPNIAAFLIGRFVQGVGSGWISGFAMVAVALTFPSHHLARVFAAVTSVWGVATLAGPLVGGLYAERGDWRGVFWLFVGQAVVFSAAAFKLMKQAEEPKRHQDIAYVQLLLLGIGVSAIALANLVKNIAGSALLVVVGFGFLGLLLRANGRASGGHLLPRAAADLRTPYGAAYAAMFANTAASMGLLVYGPVILQQTLGLSPLWAGYVVGAEALAWTCAALSISHVHESVGGRWINAGVVCIVLSVCILTVVMHSAHLGWIVFGAVVMGIGFGLCSSLMNRGVIVALPESERAIGSSALMAVRQTGGAAGAAIAGVAANLTGLQTGFGPDGARSAAVAVFAVAIPIALAGMWAAFRLTSMSEAVNAGRKH